MLAMLRRETEIRLSSELQEIFDSSVKKGEFDKVNNIFTSVQLQVIREFGFEEHELEDGLNLLRSASSSYPDDIEIRNAAYYIKYNRSCQGDLKEGDSIPDLTIYTVDQQPIRLLDYYNQTCRQSISKGTQEIPLVVFSGSLT
jgi:hypothetical protein